MIFPSSLFGLHQFLQLQRPTPLRIHHTFIRKHSLTVKSTHTYLVPGLRTMWLELEPKCACSIQDLRRRSKACSIQDLRRRFKACSIQDLRRRSKACSILDLRRRSKACSIQDLRRSFKACSIQDFRRKSKSYSLYPWTTFVLRTGVVTARVGESESRSLKKYHERGWPYVPGVDESPKNPVRDERCVTDTFSWVVPLNTSGVAKPATPDYAIQLSSWQHLVPSRLFTLWGDYWCDVAQVSCDNFRHRYLCSGRWFKYLVDQIRGMQHFRRKMLIWKDADSGWWGSG